MAPITVSARRGAPEETAADTRVVGVFEGDSLDDPALQRLIDLGEAKRGLKKVAVAHEDAPGGGQRRVLSEPRRRRRRVRACGGHAAEAVLVRPLQGPGERGRRGWPRVARDRRRGG